MSRRSVPAGGTVAAMRKEPNTDPPARAELPSETLAALAPDPGSPLPRTRQLYLALYGAIIDGRLPPGAALPPSRALAASLGIARNTVVAVYGQLSDESLVEGAGRRGTRVLDAAGGGRRIATAARAGGRGSRTHGSSAPAPVARPAKRTRDAAVAPDGRARDFAPGEPDATLFPVRLWTRALARAATLPATSLGYRPGASLAVRESIGRWLATRRSLVVDPERIVVTSGTRQSLALAALLGADPGDVALVESPGYRGAAEAFAALGLRVRAGAVDAEGLVVPGRRDGSSPKSPGESRDAPRLVYVTPCFQYPSGVALSAARRASLLELSAARGTIVFEDDYDSEFRDAREPRPALAAEADASGATVLHAGTFSKLLFPAARVGWLVVPPGWAPRAEACLRTLGGGHGQVLQAAVAGLLDDGSVAAHLRRARAVYLHRGTVLDERVERSAVLRPVRPPGGALGRIVELRRPVPLARLEAALADAGVGAVALERLGLGGPPELCRALVLGLGNVGALSIPDRLRALERSIDGPVNARTAASASSAPARRAPGAPSSARRSTPTPGTARAR